MRLDYSGFKFSHLDSGKNLESAASMRMMIIMRERKRQLTSIDVPERILNNKLEAYKFTDLLDIRRPKLISRKARHDELPSELHNFVIKPLTGRSSRGVYAVFNENVIQKVKTAEIFSGRETLVANLKADLQSGATNNDRWIIEELIVDDKNPLTAARDLKFYCFYGRVAQVLEVIRDPETRFCTWDADGKMKDVGAFEGESFVGNGFTPEMLHIAEQVSAEIPAPFMRIDFHATGSELVFCEFTPTSGGFWEYSRETDQFLGEYYLDAETRLVSDLLSGKRFDIYSAFYLRYQTSHQPVSEPKPVVAAAAA
jgi:hypothetical protein